MDLWRFSDFLLLVLICYESKYPLAKDDLLYKWIALCNCILAHRVFLVRFQFNEDHKLCGGKVRCCQWKYPLVVLFHSNNYFFRDSGELNIGKENSCRWCEWGLHCSQGLRSSEAHICENSRRFYNRDCEYDYASDNIHRFSFKPFTRHASLWAVHHRSRSNSLPNSKSLLDVFWTLKFRKPDCVLQKSSTYLEFGFPRHEYYEVWHQVLCNYFGFRCQFVTYNF